MITVLLILVVLVQLAILGLVSFKIKQTKSEPQKQTFVSIDTRQIEAAIHDIPSRITQSIVNTTNTYKGAVGELIGYLQLKASYDRIIPLGDIVDFVCIKFPKDNVPGRIDFVDVKTGDKARLSKDQRVLRTLIQTKQINFIQLKVTDDPVSDPTSD